MPTHPRKTILLATDQQQSVLNSLDSTAPRSIVYTPYGHRPRENGLLSLIGFNGQLPDALTGHYHLGNGYRQFNPLLMRFNSPDSWSPFGAGGLNAYAYCGGDPVNRIDPDGHKGLWQSFLKGAKNRIGIRTPSKFDTVRPATKQNKTTKNFTNAQSSVSKGPQADVQADVKSYDLFMSGADKSELNPTLALSKRNAARIENLEFPFIGRNINAPDEKLANLRSARAKILYRLASTPTADGRFRQAQLNSIDEMIKHTERATQIRNPHATLSI